MISKVIENESSGVNRLQSGGEEELSYLFDRHRADLKKMVKTRISAPLQARTDASDIVQDGYLEAARQLPEYLETPDLPPLMWIWRIVRQTLSRHIRFHVNTSMRSTQREIDNNGFADTESSPVAFALADSISSPSSQVARQETYTEVLQLLETLDPLDREVLSLKQLEGLTFQQVATQLDMDVSAVKRRFQRAILRLGNLAGHLT